MGHWPLAIGGHYPMGLGACPNGLIDWGDLPQWVNKSLSQWVFGGFVTK